jgi:ABC-type Zn2+ transport system substrate-binding protein/surface adhesin
VADHDHDHDHERDDEHEHEHEHEHDELSDEEAQAEAERLVRKEIALSQIRQYGDPVLRMRAEEADEVDDELRAAGERMIS